MRRAHLIDHLLTNLTRLWPGLALGIAGVSAQVPSPEPAQVDPHERIERNYQGPYSESHSRELFRACDSNSDDRLDVFETAEAFDVLRAANDHKGYARFDTDRNGFVSWPEFDHRFRKSLTNGGTFRVRTSRPFVMPEPPPQPLTPLQKFLRIYDNDGDGGLSPSEVTDLLKRTGLPEALAAPLLASDLDQSGKIEEAELAPWFQALPVPPPADPANSKGGLPQPWLDADANQDSAIDESELTTLLRRLDPGLLRWTAKLLSKLDQNSDRKLTANELVVEHADPQAPAPAGKGAKAKAASRTKPAPER